MPASADVFLAKAQESLAGAESEFANGRYNNCANRCYYACFQAAVAALIEHDMQPQGKQLWKHEVVQGWFIGELINRRKRYPSALKEVFVRAQSLREAADYELVFITAE